MNSSVEIAVLGCLIADPSAPAFDRIKPEYFESPINSQLFQYLQKRNAATMPIDLSLCWADLKGLGLLQLFNECMGSSHTLANFGHYLAEIRKKYIERALLKIIDRSVANGGPQENDLKLISSLAEQAQDTGTNCGVSAGERIAVVIQKIEDNYGKKPELSWGIPALDEEMWGAHFGELVTVGAYAGVGKTTTLTWFAWNMARSGRRVLYFTTEISADQFLQLRVLPIAGDADACKIRRNSIGPSDKDAWRRIAGAAGVISSAPLFLNDLSSPSLGDIAYSIREWKPDAVFVDYLGRCRMPRAENRVLQVNEMMRGLKNIARDSGVAMIIAAQLNRQSQATTGSPTLSHLRESGSIEQESDSVLLLHQKDPAMDCIEVIVAKNRFGRQAITYIHRDSRNLTLRPCHLLAGCSPLPGDRRAPPGIR